MKRPISIFLGGAALSVTLLTHGSGSAGPVPPARIAFTSNRTGTYQIHTMKPDGTEVIQRTSLSSGAGAVSWSPDNSKLLFTNGDASEIFQMNLDGTGLTTLTNVPPFSHGPQQSVNNWVAFSSNREGSMEVYSLKLRTGATVRLTDHPIGNHSPSWSPDGSKIVFISARDSNFEIYTMNTFGGELTRLTSTSRFESQPAWSPDGTRIASVADRPGGCDIYTMNIDGTASKRLTTTGYNRAPTWSPDSSKIAFETDRTGNREIFTMTASGDAQTNISLNPAIDSGPSWSR